MNRLGLLLLLLLDVFVVVLALRQPSMSWLIDIKHGGRKAANKIAKKYNLVNRGNVSKITITFIDCNFVFFVDEIYQRILD